MQPIIEAKGLSYSYPDGTRALEGITFALQRGERLAVLGPNGAGKSTLLLLLAGLVFGDGHLAFEGEPVTRGTARRRRGFVGLVFQDPDDQLIMPTVLDDVMFGPRNQGLDHKQAETLARGALETMGALHLADRPPHHLSVGQKRRVAIAGVLAMTTKVLALDEPASGLDPRGRGRLVRLLEGLDQTLIIATHDLALARRLATLGLVLHDGRQQAFGPLDNILADHDLLHRTGLCED